MTKQEAFNLVIKEYCELPKDIRDKHHRAFSKACFEADLYDMQDILNTARGV